MASKELRSRASVVPRELRKQRIPPDRLLTAVLLAHRLAPPELPTLIHYDYDIMAASVRGTLIVCGPDQASCAPMAATAVDGATLQTSSVRMAPWRARVRYMFAFWTDATQVTRALRHERRGSAAGLA
jgi:hypothetical protein